MRATASSRARASRRAPSRSCCSKWNASRCADLTPTPGSRRSASIRPSRAGSLAKSAPASEGELHARRQRHAGGELAHLLGADLLGLADGVVEGGGDEVLQHVLVVGEQAGVDRDPADVVLAGHPALHEAGARLTFLLELRKLFLRLLQV